MIYGKTLENASEEQTATMDEAHCYHRHKGDLSNFRSQKSNQSSNHTSVYGTATNHNVFAKQQRHVFNTIIMSH